MKQQKYMSDKTGIIPIDSKNIPEISEVGGKGYSLVKLSLLNLNVPKGIILTVNFFQDWITKIKNSSLYKSFLESLNN